LIIQSLYPVESTRFGEPAAWLTSYAQTREAASAVAWGRLRRNSDLAKT